MMIPSNRNNSRWESIPTQQNPHFPRNVYRVKRDPPKMVRRLSSRRILAETNAAALLQVQDEFEKIDIRKPQIPKRTLLDGLIDSKIKFDRKGHPIIIVRRSTTRSSCSDITVDSGFFSDYGDEEEEGYISEEESLVDDDDDEDSVYEASLPRISQRFEVVPEEPEPEIDDAIPRILVLALEPYNASVPVHLTRILAQEVRRKFGPPHTAAKKVAVDTVGILTDSQVDDDSRDDRFILTMAAIKKHIQRTQPKAVVVVTEDTLTSHMTVEAFENAAPAEGTTKILLQKLKSSGVPTNNQTTCGAGTCQQWTDRIHKACLGRKETTPIVFLHIPPFLPQAAVYQYPPRMEAEASVKGISLAISWLASGLEGTKHVST